MNSYPLACSSWDQKEIDAINTVIESGMYSMGKYVRQFEERFAEFVGSKYCVMVNSGSSANLLAIAALFYTKEGALERSDEVIVPAVSWSTTYFPLQQYGLKVKFVDIDKDTLNYDLEKLEEAISGDTKLIVAVNLLGNPNDYDKINQIIGDKEITVVEDNCESMGAEFNGKQAGTFGKLGTYSSFFSHHISTMEGGMVVTDDEELYHVMLSIRAHGWTRNLPKDNLVCELNNDPFYESFRFVLPGYNLRPLEMSGAIGCVQLEKLPSIIEGRRENGRKFKELFSELDIVSIQSEIGNSSWFGFSIVLNDAAVDRKVVVEKLTEMNVDCRPIVTGNFLRNPVIKYFDYEVHSELSNANHIHDNGFFIGNHHYPVSTELESIRDVIAKLTLS